jgi:hypothetical protein
MGAALLDFPTRQIKDEEEPEYDTGHRPEPAPRQGSFVIVPDQVRRLAAARRDPLMAQVYLTLAAHANRDGVCWPSQTRLAAESGISERKVRSAITAFCETGIVSIERRGRVNIYHLQSAGSIPDIDYDANCRNVVPVSDANKDDEYRHQGTSRRHVGTQQRHVTTDIPAPRAAKLDTRTTPKNKNDESARGRRLSEADELTEAYYLAAIAVDFPLHLVPAEFAEFKDYWISASGQNAVKRDWPATFRNHLRRQFTRQKIRPVKGQSLDQLAATGTDGHHPNTPAHWLVPDF